MNADRGWNVQIEAKADAKIEAVVRRPSVSSYIAWELKI
jgi:hypothetical protein